MKTYINKLKHMIRSGGILEMCIKNVGRRIGLKPSEVEVLKVALAKKSQDYANLIVANGKLKRDLDTEIRQKEELSKILSNVQERLRDEMNKYSDLSLEYIYRKRELDMERGKNEKLIEQVMELACPDDCKGHALKSPGGSYCRNCKRNPHAVDKYQQEEE